MLYWLEEQILIFFSSSAKYILPISLVLSIALQTLSNYYWDKFDEVKFNDFSKKLEYRVKAKRTRQASLIILITGMGLAITAYKRKKRFYDGY